MFQHGECKTPGGKLVAVKLTISNDTLQDVQLHGDFFLHPESASASTLSAISAALVGLPTNGDVPALAARIQSAIPLGVELLGTSPEAVAIAVHRAITGNADAYEVPALERIGTYQVEEIHRLTQDWQQHPWRILPEQTLSAAMNVALDEVLTDAARDSDAPPTLRFWRWSEPAVIIGRCQSVTNEVDVEAAKAMGLKIVRRMTGGGAMFLQPHGAITYSLYIPEKLVEGLSIRQSYEICDAWVIRGLRELGVDAHHVPLNDIACSEGKIGGAAQARRRGVVLHHTTMAYDMDPGEMVKVLRIGREKLKDKGVASAAKRVSPLVRQTGLSRDEIVRALQANFHRHYGGQLSELSSSELQQAEELVQKKYGHPTWTHEYE